MAASRHLIRSSFSSNSIFYKYLLSQPSRFMATSPHQSDHDYSERCDFLGSWEPSKDPKEAQEKLAMLRRDYAKQVRELRKEYFNEMELQRQEKQKKDEAKKEATRKAKEERKAAKAALSKAKAAERKVFEEEFRQTLVKERADKLEYWKKREEQVKAKKEEKKELLTRKSSMWISENELEKKIVEAVVDSKAL